ncbi:MAG: polypeptide deformylase [Candidatus Parcubacteria bacterium]|jgi:peptide deformylase
MASSQKVSSAPREKKKTPIVMLGNPILRAVSKTVSKQEMVSAPFKQFLRKMFLACEQYEGVGIAAPQLGNNKRVFVMYIHDTSTRKVKKIVKEVFINPKIIQFSNKIKADWEGCLSLPDVLGKVPRPTEVDVEYTNAEGERVTKHFNQLEARIIQHEIDHLDGIMYTDRMDDMRTLMTVSEFRKLKKAETKAKARSKSE